MVGNRDWKILASLRGISCVPSKLIIQNQAVGYRCNCFMSLWRATMLHSFFNAFSPIELFFNILTIHQYTCLANCIFPAQRIHCITVWLTHWLRVDWSGRSPPEQRNVSGKGCWLLRLIEMDWNGLNSDCWLLTSSQESSSCPSNHIAKAMQYWWMTWILFKD